MKRLLLFEQLERREMLAFTLTISGTETVRLDGDVVTLTLSRKDMTSEELASLPEE